MRFRKPKPKKIFAIDIGTNSIHGIIADIDENKNIRIFLTDKKSIRLGANINNGLINSFTINETISVLNKFKQNALYYSPVIYKAVATSAVREAINRDEFINSVRNKTGINIDIIDGNKEGYLIYKGVSRGLNFENKNIMVIDIGGGSTELIFGNSEQLSVNSIKIGAIRTSLDFFPNFETNSLSIEKCEEHILEKIRSLNLKNFVQKVDKVIGTSGTIQAIARITLLNNHQEFSTPINNTTININDLNNSFDIILSKKTPSERAKINGLEMPRAELISAGALILKNILKELSINELFISSYSLREGIVFDNFESN